MDKYNEALEKAKAYDEALGLMRDCVPDEDGLVHVRPSDIFPELKESEGERVRKEILEYFQQFENEELRGVNISDWIAWLEKQGTSYTKRDVDDAFVEGMAFAKDELEKQGKQILANSAKNKK